jgi:hypothetical protein
MLQTGAGIHADIVNVTCLAGKRGYRRTAHMWQPRWQRTRLGDVVAWIEALHTVIDLADIHWKPCGFKRLLQAVFEQIAQPALRRRVPAHVGAHDAAARQSDLSILALAAFVTCIACSLWVLY